MAATPTSTADQGAKPQPPQAQPEPDPDQHHQLGRRGEAIRRQPADACGVVAGYLLCTSEGKQSDGAGKDHRMPPGCDGLSRRGPKFGNAAFIWVSWSRFAGYLQSIVPFAIG
jgi:hypothetical protein